MEDREIIESVGKISGDALKYAKTVVKEGASLKEIADSIERYIRSKGFDIAFPVNISINEQAAHYTPRYDLDYEIKASDVIKIDLGAAKESYFGDCALTINLDSSNSKLIEATEEALSNAIAIIKDNVAVKDIGKEIERTIKSKGFIPIYNLGGHSVERSALHGDIFIPNYDNGETYKLKEGDVIAIEPFATDHRGAGYVNEDSYTEIYSLYDLKPVRDSYARALLKDIADSYPDHPFAVRWLYDKHNDISRLYLAIRSLVINGNLEPHPGLIERKRGLVAQSEATVIVEKDSCKVITER
ncbi:MAG: type II methionyl aminopeptidase [Candidatus Micrarchaeota archaeon]|nr:MAG: type II methionyl aminopeptidase [Candidatus Micrarchaeota archaeon]